MKRRKEIYLLITLSIIGIFLSYIFYPEFLSDDAFIHIGFIKGMLNGQGFSFAGNKTYGSTSPLWIILGSILTKITSSPKFSIRLLSAFFTMLSVYLLYFSLLKANIKTSIIFGAIISFVLNPFLLRWSLTGMEVTACISFILTIYLLINKENHADILVSLLLGLSVLLRPEFAAFYLVLLFFIFFFEKANIKRAASLIVPGFIIIGAWLIFAYLNFGTIIPNTYTAKASNSFFNISSETVLRNIKVFLAGNLSEIFILLILFFSLLIKFRNEIQKLYVHLKDYFFAIVKAKLILLALWIFSFYFFYILKDVTIISRYSLMLTPAIIILTAYTLNYLIKNFNNKKNVFIISYILFSIFGYGYVTFKIVKPATNNFVNGFQATYADMAQIIKEDKDERDKTVALNDVGIIGCYSGARVYDFAGLVDKSRFEYKFVKDYVSAKKPTYIILRGDEEINHILSKKIKYKILYKKFIPGFGINDTAWRNVFLYKVFWE